MNQKLTLAAIVALSGGAQAAEPTGSPIADPAWRIERLHRQHVLESSGKDTMTQRMVLRVLRAEAVEQAQRFSFSHSASAQQLEVLEAYTLKANGKRIAVPKRNYQFSTDTGAQGSGPAFSDERRVTLVFPELAVGDAVIVAHRLRTLQPLWPGKLSLTDTFSVGNAYDELRISVDMPREMLVQHKSHGLQEQIAEKGGRRQISWSWRNPQPQREERRNYSVWTWGDAPYYALSSFSSHQEIAQRYEERARPRSQPTAAVRELAEQLSAGQSDVAAQVKTLYEWVSRNLKYGGNCVGIGAVVPREVDVVLKNRMGDCKDHAALLQALLAARGIESHAVLVNAGNGYELAPVPLASQVNHVINYVPAVNLFLDATAKNIPYGRLPINVENKPALAASSAVPARTPANAGGHRQRMLTQLQLNDDGSAEGKVKVELEGLFAWDWRAVAREMGKDKQKELVREVFRGMRLEAEGEIEFGEAEGLADRFSYEARFKVKGLMPSSGSGGMPVFALFTNPAPVASFAQSASQPPEKQAIACLSGESEELYEITLPPRWQVLATPEGRAFNGRHSSYESSYQLDGRLLKARRWLQDRSPANICSAEMQREIHEELKPVIDDLRQQLLYR